jgi:hypothetical protein
MKELKLTQGKVALVDDCLFDELNKYKWHLIKGRHTYYASSFIKIDDNFVQISMHRFIMGVINSKIQVDHLDHNGLNNQKSNLRLCTRSQNSMNIKKRSNCSSIYKGVCWDKRRNMWQANGSVNKKQIHIGYYNTEMEAALAYDKFALKTYGEFALINFQINI